MINLRENNVGGAKIRQGWQVSVPVETETGNLVSELAMGRDRDQVKMYTI